PMFVFVAKTGTHAPTVYPLVAWADHVYHLAAPVGVKYIMDHPVTTILDKVRGMDVVMNACHKYDKKLLVASTSEVYGRSLDLLDDTGTRKLKEDDYRIEGSTQNHRWAYANTKAMDEFLALAFHKEYGSRVVVVRFFNTVGPRQLSQYGMVIPNFVQAALANQPLRVFGSGEQKRSFLHVQDALRAIMGLMEADAAIGQVFNVGNPIEVSINELARLVISLADSHSRLEHVSYEAAYGKGFEDMNRRTADISKLEATLNFQIAYPLEAILLDVITHQRAGL
ncbi:MAG: NAD-dependent epimerase/dehydratase family protein, partial [Sphingobacteriia bacterium]